MELNTYFILGDIELNVNFYYINGEDVEIMGVYKGSKEVSHILDYLEENGRFDWEDIVSTCLDYGDKFTDGDNDMEDF